MNLKEINEALDHRITGGSEYMWTCYPDARYLDYECDVASVSVVFNRKTQQVYEASVEIKGNHKPYRWLNPATRQDMYDEAVRHGVEEDVAWDDVKWIDLEVEQDFLGKAKAIFAGEDFDRRIQVPLELEDDEMLMLAMMAHSKDITLNQLVTDILTKAVERKQGETK